MSKKLFNRKLSNEKVEEVEVLVVAFVLGHEDDANRIEPARENVAQELDD
jgi:hypothetical protein